MTKSKPARQVTEDANIAGLTFGADQSARKKSKTVVASYRLAPELEAAIDQVAADLGVSPADVATVFFSFALEAYQDGRLQLTPKPKTLTLR